jgi:hypothetical protein
MIFYRSKQKNNWGLRSNKSKTILKETAQYLVAQPDTTPTRPLPTIPTRPLPTTPTRPLPTTPDDNSWVNVELPLVE